MAFSTRFEVAVLLLWLCLRGEGLDEDFLPTGSFRDDLLFELEWPGPAAAAVPSEQQQQQQSSPEVESQLGGSSPEITAESEVRFKEAEEEVGAGMEEEGVEGEVGMAKPPNILLPEDDYDEVRFVDMKTGSNERYRCMLPEILSWEGKMVSQRECGCGMWVWSWVCMLR